MNKLTISIVIILIYIGQTFLFFDINGAVLRSMVLATINTVTYIAIIFLCKRLIDKQ